MVPLRDGSRGRPQRAACLYRTLSVGGARHTGAGSWHRHGPTGKRPPGVSDCFAPLVPSAERCCSCSRSPAASSAAQEQPSPELAPRSPKIFKICHDQTYALCAVASCFVLNQVAYCKCDVKSGDSISLPFKFDKGEDVCTVNAEGADNGYMVSTFSLPPSVVAPGGDTALYNCPAATSDGAYAQCDGGLCFTSTEGGSFPGFDKPLKKGEIVCSCPITVANPSTAKIGYQIAGPYPCQKSFFANCEQRQGQHEDRGDDLCRRPDRRPPPADAALGRQRAEAEHLPLARQFGLAARQRPSRDGRPRPAQGDRARSGGRRGCAVRVTSASTPVSLSPVPAYVRRRSGPREAWCSRICSPSLSFCCSAPPPRAPTGSSSPNRRRRPRRVGASPRVGRSGSRWPRSRWRRSSRPPTRSAR